MQKYEHNQIEAKWQNFWEENKTNRIDLDKAEKPFYNLMMFPYPSAEGLHIGSVYTFSGIDTYGRFKRMQGYDVFEPIGLDGFGIHSENYAIKIGEHIRDVSKRTEKHFYEQMQRTGNMHDWSRTVETYKPDYYKWTQWLFTQLFKAGLAYRQKSSVNWCPTCKTVLSDEQVIDGKCERTGDVVEQRELEQWFFRITNYSERLLKNLEWMDWMRDVKVGQHNWIGKKTGINITYKIKDQTEEIVCFTTRPDTNFGATFIVIAPEHPLVEKITSGEIKVDAKTLQGVKDYVKATAAKTELDRISEGKEKSGAFTGLTAINNLNGADLPIWISDFVLAHFGTGAVVGVPGHDLRDFEFARKFDIPIKRVVVGPDGDTSEITKVEQVNEEVGKMINSEFLDGIEIKEAIEKMMDHLEAKGYGKRVVNYNLRDWCVSRQRYWGPPIPMIYCQECAKSKRGYFPEEMPGWWTEENLPVLLPEIERFEDVLPDGSGKGPLEKQEDFVKVACPNCGAEAHRETDVSDPFVDSCWYFLRYPFTEYEEIPFGGDFENSTSLYKPSLSPEEKTKTVARMKKWGPVTSYIGGKEHTVLHLLYARFITMVFNDLGYLDFEEPFQRFYGHGLITKDGAKMSKSKGNVINPDEYFDKFGADAVRLYLRFMGPFDQGGDWSDKGMEGMHRFVVRVWRTYQEFMAEAEVSGERIEDAILHRTIKEVATDTDSLKFNTSVAKFMQLMNWYTDNKEKMPSEQKREVLSKLVLMLAPYAPHFAEELWQQMGNKESVHLQQWPEFDPEKIIEQTVTIAVQVNGKLRDAVTAARGSEQNKVEELAIAAPKAQKYLQGVKPKKVIYVQDKIINFIV